jgi:pimeloyl-ACP methyl ester carboxylesterase
MSLIGANGTTLYYERRGEGPAVLFVSGATGDAGHWTGVADPLASQYSVVSYDRRGNSRSPRPSGWTVTTIDEQAEHAAALLVALQLEPATVFGTSAAAGIVAGLACATPQLTYEEMVAEGWVAASGGGSPETVMIFNQYEAT